MADDDQIEEGMRMGFERPVRRMTAEQYEASMAETGRELEELGVLDEFKSVIEIPDPKDRD